jgi:hypothetical protein
MLLGRPPLAPLIGHKVQDQNHENEVFLGAWGEEEGGGLCVGVGEAHPASLFYLSSGRQAGSTQWRAGKKGAAMRFV